MNQSFASAARLQGGGNPFLSSASKPGSKSGSATSTVIGSRRESERTPKLCTLSPAVREVKLCAARRPSGLCRW
jgi:hypothetical protein